MHAIEIWMLASYSKVHTVNDYIVIKNINKIELSKFK